MRTKTLLIIALSLYGLNNTSQATDDVYEYEKVTVTASRYQQNLDDVIPSVTIINRTDILNLQANNILDVLSLQQGIDIARNGGTGATTSVFMRGANSNHVLVLIDGMRVGSSFSGSFAWEHVPVSQIEKIEIVRGTRVSYYGSDAIGGVINIITRNQEKLYARYTGGSYDSHNFDLGFGNSNEKSQISVVFGSQKTDGFSATNDNNLFSFDPDNDGYENQSLSFNYSTDLNNQTLKLKMLHSNGDSDFDIGNSDSTERIARLSLKGIYFSDWNSELAIGNNYNELKTQTQSSIFHSNRLNFDWLLNKQVNNNFIGLGLTYRRENADFNNPNAPIVSFAENRDNFALFTNWQNNYKSNIFSLSGRFDNNSVYGNNFSADASWANRLSKKNVLNFSVGTAFHAPSINELFSPNFQGMVISPITGESLFAFAFEGNPNLKPEESINYEAGFKSSFSNTQQYNINIFYYKIDNMIDFQGPTFKPVNINEAAIKGLEATYSYQNSGLSVSINATLQKAKNSFTGDTLLRRPDQKANMSFDKNYNRFSIGSSIRYASKNPDFGILLDGYTVVDLRAAYAINKHWKVGFKLENIGDKEYQIINGYNTPKRAGYFSIEWNQ